MNYSPMEKAQKILADAYEPGGAVQPAFLDMLLQILMDLLSGCFASGTSAKDILRLGRSNKPLQQLGVRVQVGLRVRQFLGRERRSHNVPRIVDAMIAAARNEDVEETDLQELAALRLPN